MKYHLCVVWMLVMICSSSGWVSAQEPQPPTWAVGDWWIVKSQRYDSGETVDEERQPRWLPTQTWRFDVEKQEAIANQSYFVVAIHPIEDNPCPYWFRYWFRSSDRYVGRYEVSAAQSSITRTQSSASSVVRKQFDPGRTTPFLTTQFPMLPLTMPVFSTSGEPLSTSAENKTIPAQTPAYTGPEFEIVQEIQNVEVQSISAKVHPDFLGLVGNIPQSGNLYITIRTHTSIQEKQHWNPQFPWCMYGERIENATLTQRYWLVSYGRR